MCCNNLTYKKQDLKHGPWKKPPKNLYHNYLQKEEQPIWTFWKPLILYKLMRV